MHFDFVPNFKLQGEEPRYFVRSLDEKDGRFAEGYRFQIQFLSEAEQGEACIEFRPEETDFSQFPLSVPIGVMVTDYVDTEGHRRNPSFLGGGKVEESKSPPSSYRPKHPSIS
jgi:hypothetical protein